MEKKSGLGKGLSAIFGEKNIDRDISSNDFSEEKSFEIEIENILFNKEQPRTDFDEKKLQELIDSIRARGVIQPVTVKKSQIKGKYDLISGERRIRASIKAGLKKIPAYILNDLKDSPEDLLEIALIENIQREDLNPMELSNAYNRLSTEFNLTQEQIASKVHKQRSTVANFLRLQKLPEVIKESLRKNEITEAHARIILSVEGEESQIHIWKKITEQNLTVKQLEKLTKSHSKKKKSQRIYVIDKQSAVSEIENILRQFFGTKVSVKPGKGKTGEIIIEYYSDDDLERIIEICDSEAGNGK